jgi:hypothetical protein
MAKFLQICEKFFVHSILINRRKKAKNETTKKNEKRWRFSDHKECKLI